MERSLLIIQSKLCVRANGKKAGNIVGRARASIWGSAADDRRRNRTPAGVLFRAISVGILISCAHLARAEDLATKRRAAESDLARYFNKSVQIDTALQAVKGPQDIGDLRKQTLRGCPSQPVLSATDKRVLSLKTGSAGAWAGDLDGINVSVVSADGKRGGALAIPADSTARLKASNASPELSITFDGLSNVVRGVADLIGENALDCLNNLPPGEYPGDEMARICGVVYPTRREAGQTCVLITTGLISKQLADGTGYEAKLQDMTVCNFVDKGYGESPVFTTCYVHEYSGRAVISNEAMQSRTSDMMIAQAKRTATKKCAKFNRLLNSRKRARQAVTCIRSSMRSVMSRISIVK